MLRYYVIICVLCNDKEPWLKKHFSISYWDLLWSSLISSLSGSSYTFFTLPSSASNPFQDRDKSKQFQCGNCLNVYNNKDGLRKHLIYVCGQPPRLKCPYCQMVSKQRSNVQRHIRDKHKNFPVYVQNISLDNEEYYTNT